MNLNDILDFLGDFVYEIVLTIVVILFMKFYSKILFLITRFRLRNRVDLRIWVTIKLKEQMTGEEFTESINREMSQLQKIPINDMVITFNGTSYSFVASDKERKVSVVRTTSDIKSVEVRKIKDELMEFDYNTRKLISMIGILDSVQLAEITISLDKTPDMTFVGMRLSSVELNENGDPFQIRLNGDTIVFNTDFNPTRMNAVEDFITFLYTPK